MEKHKEKLFRKENKASLCTKYYVNIGSDFRYERNTKEFKNFDGDKKSMTKKKLGYDYTPLFKFLLSKVGKDWDVVFSEAKSRIDKPEPIFWMVALHEHLKDDIVRIGQSTYFSGLYVDDNNILQKVNPEAKAPEPSCTCCTFSFNGVVTKRNPIN